MDERAPEPAQTRSEIARVLRAHGAEILATWEERARELPAGRLLSEPALLDHIPMLLQALAAAFESGEDVSVALQGLPDLHALDRLQGGYDVAAAAAELAALREIILQTWTAETPGGALTGTEVQAVDRALDEIIVRSVDHFTRARERTLVALDRVSSAALGTGDLDTFLPRLLQVLLETTAAADSAYVMLREDADDRFLLRAAAGAGAELSSGFAVRAGEGFAGEVARRREPMLLHDAATSPVVKNPALIDQGVHAAYGVPLVHEDRVIGVATMASRSAYDFSEDEKQLFRTMAQRATSIIVQAQLVASRARALDALEHGDAFVLVDRDWRIVQVNATQERLSRRPRSNTLGRTLWEVWPETAEPASRYSQEYQRCMRDRVPVAFVDYYAPLDLWTEVTAYPSREGGIAVFFRDITAQKRAEEEERRRRWELDELFANTPDLACVAGVDGYFRRVNAAFTEALGFSEAELLGRPFMEIIHPDDRAAVEAELARLTSGERTTHFEIRCLRKGGGERWVSWNASPDDARQFFLGAGRDVTNAKARAEFERDLVGIVSHDLKSPLSAVLMSSAALLKSRDVDASARKAAERIQTATERAIRLVGDLLDFTRARVGGGIPVSPRPTDAHALARRIVDEVRLAFPHREIRLEVSGRGEGTWDADRLAQMLTNVVVNAVTYSPADEPVTVRAQGDGQSMIFEVHNRGEPIAPEHLPRLFEPYRRGNAAQGSSTSLGLGLFIAREIARAHRGSITVRSSTEEGTTFTLLIPRMP